MLSVRAPGSSANLGPGFDALAVAVSRGFRFAVGDADEVRPRASSLVPAPDSHPSLAAYRAAGGESKARWIGGDLPAGRGLGYSGAARVSGAYAARIEAGAQEEAARRDAFRIAAELESHADNAAASAYGGLVVTASGRVGRVSLVREPALVVWVPDASTSTARSRAQLPASVPFADAVFNVGRTALLVSALATGSIEDLRVACEDRLHQDLRLARVPASRAALAAALDAGAWGAWVSGSGPSVAAWCDPDRAEDLVAALPPDGRALILGVDHDGARVVSPGS